MRYKEISINKCKCFSCGLSWFLTQDNDGHATQHTCPRCGSDKVQYMVDSLVHDLHAGVTITDPTIFCMPSGLSKGFRFKKWMTR